MDRGAKKEGSGKMNEIDIDDIQIPAAARVDEKTVDRITESFAADNLPYGERLRFWARQRALAKAENQSCVICGEPIHKKARSKKWHWGANAQPVHIGRCCDECDNTLVKWARMKLYSAGHDPYDAEAYAKSQN
jgi:hypothetical protein